MEVVATTEWTRAPGAIRGSGDEIVGQVTHVRIRGHHAFVREHVRNPCSFFMSSNQRLSESRRGPTGQQVLELAVDADAAAWDRVSSVIAANDQLGRPVVKNPQWTVKKARHLFRVAARRRHESDATL